MKKYIILGWFGFLFIASLLGKPFNDNGNGTVTDIATGLIWQKCATAWPDCSTGYIKYWKDSIDYCESLTLGGRSDWRLPNINELRGIIDYNSYSPSTNRYAFPSELGFYWSSTTYAKDTTSAWGINFSDGQIVSKNKTSSMGYLRCVRL